MPPHHVKYAHDILARSGEIEAMMKVVGEEGTSLQDYIVFQKGEFLDAVYFQQNSFDPVDAAVTPERQIRVFARILLILATELNLSDKDEARRWFYQLRQRFLDYNGAEWLSEDFLKFEKEIAEMLQARSLGTDERAASILEDLNK
jgi:V/A-type H+-transporting ATPase subunit A